MSEQTDALHLARSRILELEEALGQASQVLQVVALDLANTQLAQYREMYRDGYKPHRIASAEAEVKSVEDAIQLARSVLNKENGGATDTKLDEVLQFLYGAAPLDGVWFGDAPAWMPRYWWRSKLREALKQAATPKENDRA